MTAEKRSILQPSENLKEFQAATCESTDAVPSSVRITRHSEVKVRVWISTDERACVNGSKLRLVGYPSVIRGPDLTGDKLHGPMGIEPTSQSFVK